MNKRDSKKSKKIRKLIVFCSLTSFIFIVATYAWFIGMRSVNVSSFEIEIASTDSLLLSLDGSKWDTEVTINSSNFNDTEHTVYAGNVNNWAGEGTSSINKGLKPISSVGEIDTTTSTMKMFEKGSLTATEGGYRLMASRIHNYDTHLDGDNSPYKEIGGYVAFDLFIRNFSGRAYYTNLEPLNEEAIYLTDDSQVKVSTTGGVSTTGIENSVRVAFAQIGRVNGKTTDVNTITGITCANTSVGEGANATPVVTGICRTAQIWEPNDTVHVPAAISYYDTSCRLRDNTKALNASDIATPGSGAYTLMTSGENPTRTHCGTVSNENSYHTYAINSEISYTDRVDVYDGADYNGYTKTIKAPASGEGQNAVAAISGPLEAYDYFTDSEKALNGMERPELITLAPNSITKVRIYVWIEGQDIDNYDFASIGKQITVNFGFTKERFDEQGDDNMQGTGPYSPTGDTDAPIITGVTDTKTVATLDNATLLNGVHAYDPRTEASEQTCTEAGGVWTTTTTGGTAACYDDLTTKIQVTIPDSANAQGKYNVHYLVSDWQGNYAEAYSLVTVSGS